MSRFVLNQQYYIDRPDDLNWVLVHVRPAFRRGRRPKAAAKAQVDRSAKTVEVPVGYHRSLENALHQFLTRASTNDNDAVHTAKELLQVIEETKKSIKICCAKIKAAYSSAAVTTD